MEAAFIAWIIVVALVALTVIIMILASIPEMRRYLRIRHM